MQQIPAIIYANHAGYQTILCDYLSDNPGQYYAKCFYLVSTTDMQSVKEVAIKEEIDGILAYASDPAALTAAYVGECLKLPTNPYHSVKILSHKDEFRTFQRNNGFACPKTYENDQDIDFPVIVKPIDSSGSNGVSKAIDKTQLEKAIDNAKVLEDTYSAQDKSILSSIKDMNPYTSVYKLIEQFMVEISR